MSGWSLPPILPVNVETPEARSIAAKLVGTFAMLIGPAVADDAR